MRAADRSRICRAAFLSKHKIFHPKCQRLLSTTSQNPQESSLSSSHDSRSEFTASSSSLKQEGLRTSGPHGSPDYIPRKRGYAPNMPIPSRKFNLPKLKTPKGIPDPKKLAPEGKTREIRSIGIEYERQLNAMRRGYVQWRYEHLKQKRRKKQDAAARPRPPRPAPFEPPFAEKMASPSSNDQLAMEKQVFGQLWSTTKRTRGEGFQSPRHQSLLARQRKELVNDYLALYHTAHDFITTPEALETAIAKTFVDDLLGFEATRPQSYESILSDMEGGSAGNIFDGYFSLMSKDKENDLYNVVHGTVAEGAPGYDEVVKEIEHAVKNDETTSPVDEPTLGTDNEEVTLSTKQISTESRADELRDKSAALEIEDVDFEKILAAEVMQDGDFAENASIFERPESIPNEAAQPHSLGQNEENNGTHSAKPSLLDSAQLEELRKE